MNDRTHSNPTLDQIRAANELYDKGYLPNWHFAVKTFEYLKKHEFSSPEVCLATVVAVDSLFATGLRYKPGRWEDIARCIFRKRIELAAWGKDVNAAHVDGFAKLFFPKSDSGRSFFSKFFHFFVSNDYPMTDSLALMVLKKVHRYRNSEVSRYPEFFNTINQLRDQVGSDVSVRQIDRYLWLMGKYIDRKDKIERANSDESERLGAKTGNEVIDLLNDPAQRGLLKRLKGNY